jgi:hypothetical protein
VIISVLSRLHAFQSDVGESTVPDVSYNSIVLGSGFGVTVRPWKRMSICSVEYEGRLQGCEGFENVGTVQKDEPGA